MNACLNHLFRPEYIIDVRRFQYFLAAAVFYRVVIPHLMRNPELKTRWIPAPRFRGDKFRRNDTYQVTVTDQ
jgi:hypothetical protein